MFYLDVQATTTPSSAAAALPEVLLAQILQHVELPSRLTICAGVSKAWASAAALATVHLEHMLTEPAIPVFERWLEQHAGQLLSMQLSSRFNDRPLQLLVHKLCKLQQLQLRFLHVRLPGEGDGGTQPPAATPGVSSNRDDDSAGAGSSSAAAVPSLPRLQHLQLSSVQLFSVNSLMQLTQSPQLSSVEVSDLRLVQPEWLAAYGDSNSAAAVQQLAEAMPRFLQQLPPQLQRLELTGMPISDAAVQQLGAMQRLQQVALTHVPQLPVCDLAQLPSSITQLQLRDSRHNPPFSGSPSLPAQLPNLAGLLQLSLRDCAVLPAVLGSLTRLQKLHLDRCTPMQLAATPIGGMFPMLSMEALLGALGKLTGLQELALHVDRLSFDGFSASLPRFSALTASSHLTRLTISPDDVSPLPRGAVQSMFPAGRQLPSLRHLDISPRIGYEEWDPAGWCLSSADILRIVSCCPGLESLDVTNSVEPGADLSHFLQLPESCASLSVGGAAFTDAAVAVLVQLTQLESLRWGSSPGFTDAGLEQLTRLDLESLYVEGCGLSPGITTGSLYLEWDPYEVSAALARQLP